MRIRADAAGVGSVQGLVPLSYRTGERRNPEVITTCGLSDDRGGHDDWGRGHQRAGLDGLELE